VDFGKIKAKFGGSSAGHNGIESIDKFIGKDYSRVRIGIGKPNGKGDVTNHVLKDFGEEEKVELENITNNIANSLPILLDKKLDLFSSVVNNK
jgi:PTH1 family peptidyl-tRNA hydrolase